MGGQPQIIAAVITSGLALVTAAIVAVLNYRMALRQRDFDAKLAEKRERETVLSVYRDPLLHAAYDLQSRIVNILRKCFLQTYFVEGTEREREYAIENTIFLIAQFLGWTEIIRQEIRFIDLGNEDQTRKLRMLQDNIYAQFRTSACGKRMRLFAGEQRAVGELMIESAAGGMRCIGFAAFLGRRSPDLDRWLDPLREDLKASADVSESLSPRLMPIQGFLIDILDLLDPGCVYFPARTRAKLAGLKT